MKTLRLDKPQNFAKVNFTNRGLSKVFKSVRSIDAKTPNRNTVIEVARLLKDVKISKVMIDETCNANFTITNRTDDNIDVKIGIRGYLSAGTGIKGHVKAGGKGSYTLNPKESRYIRDELTCDKNSLTMLRLLTVDVQVLSTHRY